MHAKYAIELGESAKRIFALSAWRDSQLFSVEEKVALIITEEITTISDFGVRDDIYDLVINHYGEKITAQIIMLIVLINSWNRIAISTKIRYK